LGSGILGSIVPSKERKLNWDLTSKERKLNWDLTRSLAAVKDIGSIVPK